MPTNRLSSKPLKVKLLAGEQDATEFQGGFRKVPEKSGPAINATVAFFCFFKRTFSMLISTHNSIATLGENTKSSSDSHYFFSISGELANLIALYPSSSVLSLSLLVSSKTVSSPYLPGSLNKPNMLLVYHLPWVTTPFWSEMPQKRTRFWKTRPACPCGWTTNRAKSTIGTTQDMEAPPTRETPMGFPLKPILRTLLMSGT